jgi:hypothetical protein
MAIESENTRKFDEAQNEDFFMNDGKHFIKRRVNSFPLAYMNEMVKRTKN